MHYPQGIQVKEANGVILNIIEDNYSFSHNCDSKPGSTGSPIINLKNAKVIGIHKGSHKNHNYNLGSFLKFGYRRIL